MTDVAGVRNLPITRPVLGEEEIAALRVPLESGWLVQGPLVREFESRFATFVDAPHAVASSSCTTALHLALAALKVQPGDEVIVPAFTWVATPNVVEYMGATPVFCDIERETFNIDIDLVEELVGPRTVGIMPVHLFGLCADMDPILETARRRKLWVVEDAACAFGSWYHGRHAGTLGDAGCFSFHPRKSITTGDGGMVTSGSAQLADKCRSLRDFGATRSDFDRHQGQAGYLLADYDDLGYNYRMTDLQAAIGVVQMDRAAGILARRAEIAAGYADLLTEFTWLKPPVTPEGYGHGFQSYVCLFAPEEPSIERLPALRERRNELMAALERDGIATRQGTHAAALTGYYAGKYGIQPADFPESALAEGLSISLPLFPQMTDSDQEFIVDSLRRAFAA